MRHLMTISYQGLPTSGDTLVNDRLVSKWTGIPYTVLGHYRRTGVLPKYDLSLPGSGQGGWKWSTVAEFARLMRTTERVENHIQRGRMIRDAAAKAWPQLSDTRVAKEGAA